MGRPRPKPEIAVKNIKLALLPLTKRKPRPTGHSQRFMEVVLPILERTRAARKRVGK